MFHLSPSVFLLSPSDSSFSVSVSFSLVCSFYITSVFVFCSNVLFFFSVSFLSSPSQAFFSLFIFRLPFHLFHFFYLLFISFLPSVSIISVYVTFSQVHIFPSLSAFLLFSPATFPPLSVTFFRLLISPQMDQIG
jgi:hypothetical protein